MQGCIADPCMALSTITAMSFMQRYFPVCQAQACTVAWSYSDSGAVVHSFSLSSMDFLLGHFSLMCPEWHFNVPHELAEDAVDATVQAANGDFK